MPLSSSSVSLPFHLFRFIFNLTYLCWMCLYRFFEKLPERFLTFEDIECLCWRSMEKVPIPLFYIIVHRLTFFCVLLSRGFIDAGVWKQGSTCQYPSIQGTTYSLPLVLYCISFQSDCIINVRSRALFDTLSRYFNPKCCHYQHDGLLRTWSDRSMFWGTIEQLRNLSRRKICAPTQCLGSK